MLIEKYSLGLGKTLVIIVTLMMIPISIGMVGAESSGVSYVKFMPNIIGLILGLILFILVIKFKQFLHKYVFELTVFALACMLSPFFLEGLEGVFRWIKIGPLLINISSIMIPLTLYNYFKFDQQNQTKAFIPIIITSLILFFQPDAGQSLALLFGMLPFAPSIIKTLQTTALLILMLVSSTVVWFQSDTLRPVQHVENIFLLISKCQYLGEVLVIVSALSIFIPIICIGNLKSKLTLSIMLYFFGALLATRFGHFPVPIIGAGLSPVLGIILAMSLIYSEVNPMK